MSKCIFLFFWYKRRKNHIVKKIFFKVWNKITFFSPFFGIKEDKLTVTYQGEKVLCRFITTIPEPGKWEEKFNKTKTTKNILITKKNILLNSTSRLGFFFICSTIATDNSPLLNSQSINTKPSDPISLQWYFITKYVIKITLSNIYMYYSNNISYIAHSSFKSS